MRDFCIDCLFCRFDSVRRERLCANIACENPVDGSAVTCEDARSRTGECGMDGKHFSDELGKIENQEIKNLYVACFWVLEDEEEESWDCTHLACIHPVDGSPVPCEEVRAQDGDCGPHSLYFLQDKEKTSKGKIK